VEMIKYSNSKKGIKRKWEKGKYRRGEERVLKEVGKLKKGGGKENHERGSTTGSNRGMITRCGFSRI